MAIQRPVRIWRAKPNAHQALSLGLEPQAQGWLQLIGGSVQVEAGPLLGQGDGLGFSAGAISTITAGATGADVLLFELQ